MAVTKIRGNTQIIDLSINALQLNADSVTESKILNDAVTADKLRDDASVDGNRAVTTNHIRDAAVTNAKVATGIDAVKLADGSVDNTEFQYLNGVTSSIQTQLDDKAHETLNNLTTTAINTSLISDTNNTDDLGSAGINWKDVHAKQLISSTLVTITASSGNVVLDPSGSNTVDVSSARITSLAEPTANTDAATKGYVDSVAAGLDPKESCRAATTAALPAVTYNNGTGGVGATLTADANGALPAQDGITLVVGNRLLVKNQAATLQNGIYTVTVVGDVSNKFVLTRATDQDGSPANEVSGGNFTFVEEGTLNADSGWVVTGDGTLTVGSDPIVWVQFSEAGTIQAGAGLTKTGTTIDVVAGDSSLTVNANDLIVKLDPAGAISLDGGAAGLQVNTGTGIEIDSNSLRISSAAAGDGLGYSAGVLSVNVAAAGGLELFSDSVRIKSDTATTNTIGITTTSNGAGILFNSTSFTDSGSETLALASSVAGDGLALTSGILSVNVDDSTIEIATDTLRLKDAGITYAKTRLVTREVPSGLVNGSNTAFDTANNFTSGSEHVYLNGILQNVGAGNDYVVTDANTITFNTAPQTNDVILISYWRA
jgi:hypothetical protein